VTVGAIVRTDLIAAVPKSERDPRGGALVNGARFAVARGSGVWACTMPEVESGPGPLLRGGMSMSEHRAFAHAVPSRSAIVSTIGGWMAGAACSLASADAPVVSAPPPRAESASSKSIEPPATAPTQQPALFAIPADAAVSAGPSPQLDWSYLQTTDPSAASPAPASAPAIGQRDYFLEAGLGQTFGPSTFLLSATGGKFVDPHLAIGPTLQLGIDDDKTIFAPTFGARRIFELDSADLRKLEPYVEGGVGFAYLEDDRRGGADDDFGVLLTLGFGANFELQHNVALGTGILVNLMPGEVLDERLFVSWRILQLNFAF